MKAEEIAAALARIEARQTAHTDRYERDQKYDRMERDEWRGKIDEKIDKLDEKIQPVVNDHRLIVVGGKWFLGVTAALWGVIKAWFFLSDRLK